MSMKKKLLEDNNIRLSREVEILLSLLYLIEKKCGLYSECDMKMLNFFCAASAAPGQFAAVLRDLILVVNVG